MATKTTTRKEELRKLTSVKICAPRRRLLSRHISQVFVHLTSHFWMAICLFTLCDFRKFPLLLSSSSVLVAWSRFCHWLPSSECLFSFPFLFLCVGAAAGGRKPNQLSKKQKQTKKQTKKLHCCFFFPCDLLLRMRNRLLRRCPALHQIVARLFAASSLCPCLFLGYRYLSFSSSRITRVVISGFHTHHHDQ